MFQTLFFRHWGGPGRPRGSRPKSVSKVAGTISIGGAPEGGNYLCQAAVVFGFKACACLPRLQLVFQQHKVILARRHQPETSDYPSVVLLRTALLKRGNADWAESSVRQRMISRVFSHTGKDSCLVT